MEGIAHLLTPRRLGPGMNLETSGRFRVLGRARGGTDLLLVSLPESPAAAVAGGEDGDADAFEPTTVAAGGYDGALADAVAALEPGNVVTASLEWEGSAARFSDVTVARRTSVAFATDVTNLFEDALRVMEEAAGAGEGLNSRVTYGTDEEPNGVVYAFADPPGRDVLEAFRTGALPLEPLLAKVNANRDDERPRAVFVLRPARYDFVLVYVVFDRESVLARTVRDTYC